MGNIVSNADIRNEISRLPNVIKRILFEYVYGTDVSSILSGQTKLTNQQVNFILSHVQHNRDRLYRAFNESVREIDFTNHHDSDYNVVAFAVGNQQCSLTRMRDLNATQLVKDMNAGGEYFYSVAQFLSRGVLVDTFVEYLKSHKLTENNVQDLVKTIPKFMAEYKYLLSIDFKCILRHLIQSRSKTSPCLLQLLRLAPMRALFTDSDDD